MGAGPALKNASSILSPAPASPRMRISAACDQIQQGTSQVSIKRNAPIPARYSSLEGTPHGSLCIRSTQSNARSEASSIQRSPVQG